MSNRTEDQISTAAEWRMGYEAQIEALTLPGLTDQERVNRFGDGAGFCAYARSTSQQYLERGCTPINAVWYFGASARSLFADLPDCKCPIVEQKHFGRFASDGIPDSVAKITPTRDMLERFMRVQMRERGLA